MASTHVDYSGDGLDVRRVPFYGPAAVYDVKERMPCSSRC